MQTKTELAQSIEAWDLNTSNKIGVKLIKAILICWAFAYVGTILFFLYVLK